MQRVKAAFYMRPQQDGASQVLKNYAWCASMGTRTAEGVVNGARQNKRSFRLRDVWGKGKGVRADEAGDNGGQWMGGGAGPYKTFFSRTTCQPELSIVTLLRTYHQTHTKGSYNCLTD